MRVRMRMNMRSSGMTVMNEETNLETHGKSAVG